MRFIYDEEESKFKLREVYLLYINDELYYSVTFFNPVKLEIDRDRRSVLINNIIVSEDKELLDDIFKLVILARDIFDIEGYEVSEQVFSGTYYRQKYGKDTI